MSEPKNCSNCIYDENPCEECRDWNKFVSKFGNPKAFELIPRGIHNKPDRDNIIYIYAEKHKLEDKIHRFYNDEESIVEIPAILIYVVIDKGYMNE